MALACCVDSTVELEEEEHHKQRIRSVMAASHAKNVDRSS
jgi:hypothetical protein